MSPVVLSMQEAKLWILAAAMACVREGWNVQEFWCLQAVLAIGRPARSRLETAWNNADNARFARDTNTPESMRDARILDFLADVLRAVEAF